MTTETHQQVRHSWKGEGSARVCQGCDMTATRHWLPASRRNLVRYARGGRSIISEHVPPCGDPLPAPKHDQATREQLATEAALRAKAVMQSDPDAAIRQLANAHVLDPSRSGTWSRYEQATRAAAQPKVLQAVHVIEPRVWLGHFIGEKVSGACGHEFIRPQRGTDEKCLSCQTAERMRNPERITQAGFQELPDHIRSMARQPQREA
jgi:hypothetical protein